MMTDFMKPEFHFSLPAWIDHYLKGQAPVFHTMEQRMSLALELSRLNVQYQTGGPFGAAIFNREKGELISVGVNLVVPMQCSVLHAEIVAIILAQQKLQTHDLGCDEMQKLELYASVEPCAMCMGAVPWSGIHHLVCGARKEDAEQIGFDEGPKPENWIDELNQRGITVQQDVLREEAVHVLKMYKEECGIIYNGRRK